MLFVGALLAGGTVDAVRITVVDAEHAIDMAWAYYLDLINGNRQTNDIRNLVFTVKLGGHGGQAIQGSCNWDNTKKFMNCGIPDNYQMKLSDYGTLKDWFVREESNEFGGHGALLYPQPKKRGIYQANAIYIGHNAAMPSFNFHIPVDMNDKHRNLLKQLLLRALVQ